MIRSMTGFGAAERAWQHWTIRVEARSVNQAHLKLAIRLPEMFRLRESDLGKVVGSKVSRGQVHVSVSCTLADSAVDLLVDKQRLRNYIRVIKDAAAAEDVPVRAEVGALMSLPGVMGAEGLPAQVREDLWSQMRSTAEEAVDEMLRMREAEGRNLSEQLREICRTAREYTEIVAGGVDEAVRQYRGRLTERVRRLLEGTQVALDEDAMTREVTFLAERSDVSEEIVRMRSHLDQVEEVLSSGDGPVGKKLEFLAQEMLREANTMASKLPSGEQSQQAIEIKLDVNRLLEQARNVE